MQDIFRTPKHFLERTDRLAVLKRVSLRGLAPLMGLSVASLFGYRNGSIKISNKAWGKLEECEASIRQDSSTESEPPAQDEPSNTVSLSDRMERLENLFEELLVELRGKDSQATSSKARGGKFN